MDHVMIDRDGDLGAARSPRWSVFQKAKNTIIYRAAWAGLWVVGRLPLVLAGWLGSRVGLLGFVLAARERRKALESLAVAYPDAAEATRRAIARSCFIGLGRAAGEVCCMHRIDLSQYVEISPRTRQVIDEALSLGMGLIWVTAHLGNWELLAAGLAARGYDVRPVATPSYDSRFTSMIDRWRRRRGVRTLWRGLDDVATGVAEALGHGAIVGLLIDQDTRTQGAFVPFFGRPAWTPIGAAALARRSGAPTVAGFISRRAGGGHVIEVELVRMCSTPDSRADDVRNTAKLTEAIERAVREHPSDWVWMHQRWRTCPEAPQANEER